MRRRHEFAAFVGRDRAGNVGTAASAPDSSESNLAADQVLDVTAQGEPRPLIPQAEPELVGNIEPTLIEPAGPWLPVRRRSSAGSHGRHRRRPDVANARPQKTDPRSHFRGSKVPADRHLIGAFPTVRSIEGA